MIISMSLDDSTLKELDNIQKQDKFASRSEVIKGAINKMITEREEINKIKGNIECIIIAKFDHQDEDKISEIKHEYSDIIKTQLHNHLNQNCIEVFVINGNSKNIISLYNKLETSRKIEYIKLFAL